MEETKGQLDELLRRYREEDREEVLRELLPQVIDEVRALARKAMAGESPDHTLQTTALVNEVYLRLDRRPSLLWNDRKHFLCDLAALMRHILYDHARKKRANKRGGDVARISFDEMKLPVSEPPADLEKLEEALTELEALDHDKYEIVLLRFYMGLTEKEISQEVKVSVNTVQRRWQAARIWLLDRLRQDAA